MDYRKEFRVDPDSKVKLSKLDPAYIPGSTSRGTKLGTKSRPISKKLFSQQALLSAEHRGSILVVLQALDAGGKDGTIKHVFTALNPQGASVASFKQPTAAISASAGCAVLGAPLVRIVRPLFLRLLHIAGRMREASPRLVSCAR